MVQNNIQVLWDYELIHMDVNVCGWEYAAIEIFTSLYESRTTTHLKMGYTYFGNHHSVSHSYLSHIFILNS